MLKIIQSLLRLWSQNEPRQYIHLNLSIADNVGSQKANAIESFPAIKRCIYSMSFSLIYYKTCTILYTRWSQYDACDSISTFKRTIIVLFDLDYHVDLSFLSFYWYKTSLSCYKSWWVVNSKFQYKNAIWFHKIVSAIERYSLFLSAKKKFFYETMTVILRSYE